MLRSVRCRTSRYVPAPSTLSLRRFATAKGSAAKAPASSFDIKKLRNIGISAHIDSGKTTLTERILYYSGRIRQIHEVKGKDGVGATMDFMDLEREKGITIQAAATHIYWKGHQVNIIDTPGHVDFTIEVERALRVLDGAVLVLCGVAGVQSQTITVDRQMRRYQVPRLVFVNKLDRYGASPWRAIQQFQQKLGHRSAALQIPIGLESGLQGLVDLVDERAFLFTGDKGENLEEVAIPANLEKLFKEKREVLINTIAEADDAIAEKVIMEEKVPSIDELKAAIRRATISRKFLPILMGSAIKNKGVQPLLDAVCSYLPDPTEVENVGLDRSKNEEKTVIKADPKGPLVALGFKLEEGKYGQLTYTRVYSGTLHKGDQVYNMAADKMQKVPRLVKMHANDMEEVPEARAGEICALFGVECNSGTTFTDGDAKITMTSMHVPDPVISLAVQTKDRESQAAFSKAVARFQKEDPTFHCHVDAESSQTIISGMGELHLEIYQERMKREYKCEVTTGKPQVAFRETCKNVTQFDYTHKKQSGGAGQYAKVIGRIEPLNDPENPNRNEFVDDTVGTNIPPEFMPAIKKGFDEACEKGPLVGHKLVGVRFVVTDGQAHVVDSSELAFRLATVYAVSEALRKKEAATILEPIMKVEVTVPSEYQGPIVGGLNKRKGMIVSSEVQDDYCTIIADVPLNNMFGYSTELRSSTQGKGEFTMEYARYEACERELVDKLIADHKRKLEQEKANEGKKTK